MARRSAWMVSGMVTGVAVHDEGERPELRYVQLQRNGKVVRLRKQGAAVDAADLMKQCGTRAPVALVMVTPRCLNKVVQRTGTLDELVRTAFPGAIMDQLIASAWSGGSGTGVSMMRREQAAPMLASFRATGLRIVDVHLGPWGWLHLRDLIHQQGSQPIEPGFHFDLSDGSLQAVHPCEVAVGQVQFGDDDFPMSHLIAASAAWEYLVPAPPRQEVMDEVVRYDRSEERARVRYERLLVSLAALLLVLLGIEQGMRWTTNASDKEGVPYGMGALQLQQEVDELRAQVAGLEAMALELGVLRNERIAHRAARVLASVPNGIVLDGMSLDPLATKLHLREPTTIAQHRIAIVGSCTNGTVLHAWMAEMRSTQGILGVKLISFSSKAVDDRPTFVIQLDA